MKPGDTIIVWDTRYYQLGTVTETVMTVRSVKEGVVVAATGRGSERTINGADVANCAYTDRVTAIRLAMQRCLADKRAAELLANRRYRIFLSLQELLKNETESI